MTTQENANPNQANPKQEETAYEIDEVIEITIARDDENFDRACQAAWTEAVCNFGVDEAGHMKNVRGTNRETDELQLSFGSFQHSATMVGHRYRYFFEARVHRSESEPSTTESGAS